MQHVVQSAGSVDGEVAALKQQFQQVVHRINHLEQENSDIRYLLKQYKHDNQELKTKIQVLESNLMSFEENVCKEVKKQNTFITFRAQPAEHRVYAHGEILLFDNVVVNLGQHYVENSTFVCPYDAFYLLTVTVLQQPGTLMRAYLMLEGSGLQAVRADDTVTYDQATVVVVTLCKEGQRVWVETTGEDFEYHLTRGSFSAFSGTLLRIE